MLCPKANTVPTVANNDNSDNQLLTIKSQIFGILKNIKNIVVIQIEM